MFEKQKVFEQLRELLRDNNFSEFKRVYQTSFFDVTSHRANLFGADVFTVLGDAILQNKPEFLDFLVQKLGLNEVVHHTVEYESNGQDYRAPILYLAIQNNMEDFALRLVKHPHVNIDAEKEIKKTRYTSKGSHTYWDYVDNCFDIARRSDNKTIIEALYDKKVEHLAARAESLKHAFFFPKRRSRNALKKATEFCQERDRLLGRPFEPPPPPPKKPFRP